MKAFTKGLQGHLLSRANFRGHRPYAVPSSILTRRKFYSPESLGRSLRKPEGTIILRVQPQSYVVELQRELSQKFLWGEDYRGLSMIDKSTLGHTMLSEV